MNDEAVYRTAPATPGLLIRAIRVITQVFCSSNNIASELWTFYYGNEWRRKNILIFKDKIGKQSKVSAWTTCMAKMFETYFSLVSRILLLIRWYYLRAPCIDTLRFLSFKSISNFVCQLLIYIKSVEIISSLSREEGRINVTLRWDYWIRHSTLWKESLVWKVLL